MDRSAPSLPFWRILVTIIILVPGLAAPFGTTILGWLAVSDIRRVNGRLSGLPLAVFDGLLFPLLVLDVFLATGLVNVFNALAVELGHPVRPRSRPSWCSERSRFAR